ncbi:hypothetical protein [Engelhardtia mirabilis]
MIRKQHEIDRRSRLLASIFVGAVAAVLFGPAAVSTGHAGESQPQHPLASPEVNHQLAPLETSSRRPAVRETIATVERDGELLEQLAKALTDRDQHRARVLIDEWLAGGPESVERLLEFMADERADRHLDMALAALLNRAVIDAEISPADFAPWTPTNLIASALGLVTGSEGNGRVLFVALDDLGRFATPELLVGLVEAQGGNGDRIVGESDQIDSIRLMQAWATEPSLAIEPELQVLIADPEVAPLARARAASLLLHRDWRANAESLVAQLGELESRESTDQKELTQDFRSQLSGHVLYVEEHERVEYMQLLANDETSFRRAVDMLSPRDAASLSAALDPREVGELQIAALRLRAGGDDAIRAGLELLPALEQQPDYSAHACVNQIVRLGGASDPAFQAALESLFERRDEGNDPFWRAVGWQPNQLTDSQVEEAIVPWLLLSEGESHRTRDRLVADVQNRFPGRYPSL